MFATTTCCQTSVASEVNEDVDSEVEAIYKALVLKKTSANADDADVEISALEKLHDIVQDPQKDVNLNNHTTVNIEAMSELAALKEIEKFARKYRKDKVEIADRLRLFRRKHEDSMDTLLHTAALFNKDSTVIQRLLKYCPDVINIKRTGSCLGQTALHITIAKEKKVATEIILKHLKIKKCMEVLSARATGSSFENTIMMGETALSVAVLTFNTAMVDLLLEHGASVKEVTTRGDTVIHTLIKYTALDRKNISKAISMLKHFKKKKWFQDLRLLWFVENKDRLTPLKLAVKLGLIDIVRFLLNMKNVFCYKSQKDGSFDSRYYDITEIDPAAQQRYSKNMEKENAQKENETRLTRFRRSLYGIFFDRPPPSLIEMMSQLKWADVQDLTDIEIIKMIAKKRWDNCKAIYAICAVVHLCVMLLFTTSSYYRQYIVNSSDCKVPQNMCQDKEIYTKVVPWLLLVYGLFLIVCELYRLFILQQGLFSGRRHNNTLYRLGLIIFALSLIVDCILYANGRHSNDVFVTALLSGSSFSLFFLRGFKQFSFYTVLFHAIILGDLLRFGVIIIIEFSAFSFVMYIILSGNKAIEDFSTFENTTLTMFSYMLGLKDLDLLKAVDTESQRLVAGIYVLFIITTYIILINSLIAMMSSTSQATAGEKDIMTLVQQSSVSLFLDGVKFRRSMSFKNEKPKLSFINLKRFYMLAKIKEIGEVMSKKRTKENLILKDVKHEFGKISKSIGKKLKPKVELLKAVCVSSGTQYEAPEVDTYEMDVKRVLEIYHLE